MSAFTNWNGPGPNGGANLPQIQTLEQLIVRMGDMQSNLRDLYDMTRDHVNQTTLSNLHMPIQQEMTAQYTALLTAIRGTASGLATLQDAVNAANTYTDGKDIALNAKIDTETSRATAAEAAINARLTGTGDIATMIASIAADIAAYKVAMTNAINTQTLTVSEIKLATGRARLILHEIMDCTEIYSAIYPRRIIDFRNMAFITGQVVPVANVPNVNPAISNKVVVLLGYMSDIWDPVGSGLFGNDRVPEDHPLGFDQQHKACRVYIKFANTRPWNAIVDMAATYDSALSGEDAFTGAINVVCAKTESRNELGFGIYRGTSADGVMRFYLGIETDDTAVGNGFFGSDNWAFLSGQQYYIGGVNFIPMNAALAGVNRSNVAVHEITSIKYNKEYGVFFDSLVTNKIHTDNYLDRHGHGVAVTDEDAGLLTIGHEDADGMKLLRFFSTDRPSIVHRDYAQHQLAYLTDLLQSIYWQRSVAIVVDEVADLTNLLVWTRDDTGAIVTPTWIPPSGVNKVQVPGFYIVEPTAEDDTIAGYKFKDGDVALVKDSGTQIGIPEAKLNDILAPAILHQQFPATKITGAGGDQRIVDGLTVVDNAGNYGKVFSVNTTPAGIIVEIDPILDSSLFQYTVPGYVEFIGTAWAPSSIVTIGIPETFDGYLNDVTYQWAGYALAQNRTGPEDFYVPTTFNWTVQHENYIVYDEFGGDPWDYIEIYLAGFRSSLRQSEIDTAILDYAMIQPDHAMPAHRMMMPVDIPERPTAMMPHPAYVHHRAWNGLAILDGGSFTAPHFYAGWMVDGGDFSKLPAHIDALMAQPPVPQDQQFRNVQMKLWRGPWGSQPELVAAGSTLTPAEVTVVWNAYAFILRWCQFATAGVLDPIGELAFTDGVEAHGIFRFIPLQAYQASDETVMQTVTYDLETTSNEFTTTFELTDFATPGVPAHVTQALIFASDQGADDGVTLSGTPYTIEFQYVGDVLTFTSPRMLRLETQFTLLEARVTQAEADIVQLRTDLDAEILRSTTIDADHETRISNLETDMTQAQADIVQLQTDMTQAQGDITQLQTDVAAAQADATQAISDAAAAQADATQAIGDAATVATALATEVTRATGVETGLDTRVAALEALGNFLSMLPPGVNINLTTIPPGPGPFSLSYNPGTNSMGWA